jgi:hypothetical protein
MHHAHAAHCTPHTDHRQAPRAKNLSLLHLCVGLQQAREHQNKPCANQSTEARAFHLATSIHNEQQKKESKKGGGAGYRSLCLLHAKQALYHLSYTPIDYESCDCSCSTLILLSIFFLHSSLKTHMDSLDFPPVHHTSAVTMFPPPPFPTHLATYTYVSDTEPCGCPLPLVLLPRSLVG